MQKIVLKTSFLYPGDKPLDSFGIKFQILLEIQLTNFALMIASKEAEFALSDFIYFSCEFPKANL